MKYHSKNYKNIYTNASYQYFGMNNSIQCTYFQHRVGLAQSVACPPLAR